MPKRGKQQVSVVDEAAWQQIESELPANWEQIAVRNGLGPPATKPHNASDVGAGLKVRTVLTVVGLNLSLRVASAMFAGAGLHDVSHVGIHGWMKASVKALQALLATMVSSATAFAPDLWAGYTVRAIDATTAQSPGAEGTTARIHYALRLSDMRPDQILVTDDKTGETLRNFTSGPDILDVADRGYSNPPSIAAAVAQGGDVLARWNFASLPLLTRKGGDRIDPRRATRGLKPGQKRELLVEVRPSTGGCIRGRLLVERLPDDQARKARQRSRADHGGKLAVEMAAFVMLFTTVPQDRLSADLLRKLYRLRWQVELQFKREKSIGGLDKLPNFLPETVSAWLLAKMLLAQIARRLLDRQPAQAIPSGAEPCAISAPWESAVAAWMLLRNGLLAIGLEHLPTFLARFSRQVLRLRMAGKRARRQVDDFLSTLRLAGAA